ncbi:NAD(P)-binding domain-containing protein [Nocardia sp. CDC153]|uniref:NAD(P)-dependent oxidoreductase n=1 Tax=Nocardia sp. CDC153 TaxID=3112167 RepID=UPI002DB6EDCD|nr:NAD(P)-binding domain-containing protein [Nocardia sp. CDC153]MEC3956338.1 NAD(P)-binding domain-containing protein [Nocardia sp. CDC153]
MTNIQHGPVTVLGLGAMGSALVQTLRKAGVGTAVWNRTAGKDVEVVAAGAVSAGTVAEAVRASELVIAVLFDHASVHETLDPIVGELAGKQLLNLTSTSPEQSRELARWATEHGIEFLDGGIMAVPSMIGGEGASILYSGSRALFDRHRPLLELWGSAEYFGADAGLAALTDFALLTNMYAMFGGFFQGVALVGSAGVSASEFAPRAAAYMTAMAQMLPGYARIIDTGDYTGEVFQDLVFTKSAMDALRQAAADAGISAEPLSGIAGLVDRQVAEGHGAAAFERSAEALRQR